MPAAQTMLPRVNALATPPMIGEVDPDLFAPGTDLVEALAELEVVGGTDPEVFHEYLASIPAGMQESLRALVYHNLTQREGGPIGMTFAWAPAYDWELRIWEAAGTPDSRGGITVLLCSRYPRDPVPADGPAPAPN